MNKQTIDDKLELHYVIMIYMKSGFKHMYRGTDENFLQYVLDAFKIKDYVSTIIIPEDAHTSHKWEVHISVAHIEAISVLPKKILGKDLCEPQCYETKCKGYCLNK